MTIGTINMRLAHKTLRARIREVAAAADEGALVRRVAAAHGAIGVLWAAHAIDNDEHSRWMEQLIHAEVDARLRLGLGGELDDA